MSEVLGASLEFPTIVFTVVLGVALVFWLFVILGALDLDVLGGPEAEFDAEAANPAALTDFMHILGLTAVPVTVSLSAVALVGWVTSLLTMHWLAGSQEGDPGAWLPPLVLIGVTAIAVPVAALLVRPLRPVFRIRSAKFNRDYIGSVCRITTGWVDEGFGQATLEDGGNVLVITVHASQANTLGRGDQALIIDFDAARQAYEVVCIDDFASLPKATD